jgi:inorganic pyrophosphatase
MAGPAPPTDVLPPLDLRALRTVLSTHFSWVAWERVIERKGITIDRPAQTAHPEYSEIVYPMDYGFIPDTMSTDGEAVDVFVGEGALGLVGLILTTDHRQTDREMKLLVDCTPPEIYTAHGFINYDRTLLEGVLVLRYDMPTLWEKILS